MWLFLRHINVFTHVHSRQFIDSPSPSNRSPVQSFPEESYADGDERWKERLLSRIPEMSMSCSLHLPSFLFLGPYCVKSSSIHLGALEEVEDPPDTVACHTETPHMLRLMSKYVKESPQVWQTSTTPEGARHGMTCKTGMPNGLPGPSSGMGEHVRRTPGKEHWAHLPNHWHFRLVLCFVDPDRPTLHASRPMVFRSQFPLLASVSKTLLVCA